MTDINLATSAELIEELKSRHNVVIVATYDHPRGKVPGGHQVSMRWNSKVAALGLISVLMSEAENTLLEDDGSGNCTGESDENSG